MLTAEPVDEAPRSAGADGGAIPGSHYYLQSLASAVPLFDDPATGAFPLSADGEAIPSLLRAFYRTSRFAPNPHDHTLFRFRDWLPVSGEVPGSGAPVTFHAKRLGEHLGLANLIVTASGWWPDREIGTPTGTFKEHEAYAVYARLGARAFDRRLVVASAGNTARAFMHVAARIGAPLLVVVPEDNLEAMWTLGARAPSVTVVAVGDGADYSDAIALAALVSGDGRFRPEGGAKNVARRDGMGTTFLSGAEFAGRVPDHYLQAVGSGTGAIAAWEANLRLIGAAFDWRMARIHVAQNAPFAPIVESWKGKSRRLQLPDGPVCDRAIAELSAPVLANRRPPWGVLGGLYDALESSDGSAVAVTNDESAAAAALFEQLEGIDPSPAAAVACAQLVRLAHEGRFGSRELVQLNLTGCGLRQARSRPGVAGVEPDLVIARRDIEQQHIVEQVYAACERRVNARIA